MLKHKKLKKLENKIFIISQKYIYSIKIQKLELNLRDNNKKKIEVIILILIL